MSLQNLIFSFKSLFHQGKNDIEENSQNGVNTATMYCMKRCIQGLASSRESSRHGFYICLTEVLRLYNEKRKGSGNVLEEILDKMDEHLNPSHTSKGEEGEYLVGKTLCLRAIMTSGILGPNNELVIILERLVKLGSQRSYLKVFAYRCIVDYLKTVKSFHEFESQCWPKISTACKWGDKDSGGVESLYLFLEIADQFPQILKNKAIMLEVCEKKKLITEDFAREVSSVIMGGTIRLKIVRDISVLSKLVSVLSKQPSILNYFWSNIDQMPSSIHKNTIKFLILDAILEKEGDATNIPTFFTKNTVSSIMQILSRVDSTTEEESIIISVFERLISKAKDNKEILKPILKLLLKDHGKITFDKITGHGFIQKLTSIADAKAVKTLAKLYMEALSANSEAKSDANSPSTIFSNQERIYSAQLIAKLVGHPVMQDEMKWKVEILTGILSHTLFELKQPYGNFKRIPKPLPNDVKAETKEIFFRALDVKAKNFEAMCLILTSTLEYTNDLLSDSKIATPLYPLSDNTMSVWKKLFETVQKLGKDNKKESKVFQLLFTHMGFQLFIDPEGAQDIINDLYICAEESEKSSDKNIEDGPNWVEVVVDSLISLMSQNTHVLRKVVNSVMALLCPHITVNALQAVMDVINPQEGEENEIPGDSADSENGEDSNEEDEETVEASEDDKNEDEASENGNSEDETSEDEDDDDKSDSDEEKDKVDQEFKDRIKDALGDAKAESEDDDNESIDMDDLDDEAMEKMDTALGMLFKQLSGKKNQAQKKKEKKNAVAQMHFKIRCLDVIDVYLDHHPKMSHVVALIKPLLDAIEKYMKNKNQQQLTTRLKNTLKKITKSKKVEDVDDELDPSSLIEMLRWLINISNSSSALITELSQPNQPLYAECCTLIVKFSLKLDDKKINEDILDVYQSALKNFFNKT